MRRIHCHASELTHAEENIVRIEIHTKAKRKTLPDSGFTVISGISETDLGMETGREYQFAAAVAAAAQPVAAAAQRMVQFE